MIERDLELKVDGLSKPIPGDRDADAEGDAEDVSALLLFRLLGPDLPDVPAKEAGSAL